MSAPHVEPSLHAALSSHLVRFARRAFFWKASRAAAVGFATLAFLLLLSSWLCGPSISLPAAAAVWIGLPMAAVAAASFGLGSTRLLRGPERARLLEPFDARLARRVQSAAELAEAPNGSAELVRALADGVKRELDTLPVERAIAKPQAWSELTLGAVLVTVATAATLWASNDAKSGLYALLHPGLSDSRGAPMGVWIDGIEASFITPEYLGSQAGKLKDPQRIEVPAGSRLSIRVHARLDTERAVLGVGDRTLPFTRVDAHTYAIELTADRSGPLSLRASVSEQWITDARAPVLAIIADNAPTIMLDAPAADRSADSHEPVPFAFRVRDDHGLSDVDLVVQLGPKRERRISIARLPEDNTLDYGGATQVVAADFGAEPGSTLTVWIEARDRDAFKGPNVGRSPTRTITVSRIDNPRGAPIAMITEARDRGLDALGKRLEAPTPVKPEQAEERVSKVAPETRLLVSSLEALADAYAKSTGDQNTGSTLRDMVRRIGRLGREEKEASPIYDPKRWEKTHEALVAELEDDIVWLTDLIGRARLADAENVLNQLEATRARMRALLDELKNSSDPQRKQELMQEIARARAELRELSQRLAQAQGEVPSDFVNYEALEARAKENPLDAMQRALESGDMEAAERALAELDSQLEGLRGGLGEGQQAFADARISPRQKALAEARAEIDQLTRAQQSLANETARAAQGESAASNDENFKAQAERLAQQAERLEQRARSLEASRVQPALAEAQAGAAQRLRDARDALRRGDSAEAEQMAQRAASDLGDVASEMSLDARMYPGPDGSRLSAAREASQLARETRSFAEEVGQNAPSEPHGTTPEQAEALRQGAPAQQGLSREAKRAASQLDENGPPGLRDGLERVQKSMRSAAEAMERGDSRDTQGHQRDALDRLTELGERLREEQDALGGQRQASAREGEGEGDGKSMGDEKVTIPGESDDPRRADLRRRVLDARRARAPESFGKAIERYYQEILR